MIRIVTRVIAQVRSRARPALLAVLGALAMSGTATATTTVVGALSNPLGLHDLVVGGTAYDVYFSTQSYGSLFPTSAGLLDITDGAIAAGEIAAAFNSAGVTGLLGLPCTAAGGGVCDLFIPSASLACGGTVCTNDVSTFNGMGGGISSWVGSNFTGSSGSPFLTLGADQLMGVSGCSSSGYNGCFALEIAYFVPEPAPVPEPAIVALLGLGAAGIGLMRRRTTS